MNLSQEVHNFGLSVDDFSVSPFEAIEMLHIRSRLHHHINELDEEHKRLLQEYDQKLFENALRMYKHISQVYNFSKSDEPDEEWWWHLDKVVQGKLSRLRD